MFNNIIYFIFVLLIYNISYPESPPDDTWPISLLMICLGWMAFAVYCRWSVQHLRPRLLSERQGDGILAIEYHRLILRLSIMAVLLFSIDVYIFQLKYWIRVIPGLKPFSVLQGTLALSIFFLYLVTIWYHVYALYAEAFRTGLSRRSFIISNVRFNVPILFPWMFLSLIHDLISLVPLSAMDGLLNRLEGNILFFAAFLVLLMIIMPRFIQYWWGCEPFAPSEKVRELKAFLAERGFRYRELLRWPIFEGRMITAGIMGIIPRYRYILMTDVIMEILTLEELKAVTAHEMGHARYRHLLFYVLFFLGYMALSFGSFDLLFYFFAAQPYFMEAMQTDASRATSLFTFVLSIPTLVAMLIYFRYVMGFFMRHFERQADLYSAVVMGSPRYTISSLEKIALLSGKIRNLPSWHHFSIAERVMCLDRMRDDPGIASGQNRFVALSFALYLVCIISLGYLLNFSDVKQNMVYTLLGRSIDQQITQQPGNVQLYLGLAMLQHETGRFRESVKTYEKILRMDPNHDMALNNLAWILVTASDRGIRDPERGLHLAQRAVSLKRIPTYLDTLAEAYYVNGFSHEALETIKEALSLARENEGYYQKQIEKFKQGPKS